MEPYLRWRDEWLLGIDVLDQQHKALADCLNRLVCECSCAGEPGNKDDEQKRLAIAGLLDELHSRTKAHFADEEALMRKEGYPGYAGHAREHAMLLGELKSTFAAKLREGCSDMSPDILKALRAWLIVHVARSDREFANYLLNRRHQMGQ